MPGHPPDNPKNMLEILKELWPPIAGFLGAITLAYNFYQLWLGDPVTVTYFMAGSGLLVLLFALFWVGFSTQKITRPRLWPIGATITESKPRYEPRYRWIAWGGLGIVALCIVVGATVLIQRHWEQEKQRAKQEQKLVIIIAAFEGPEEVYGLRNEIIEKLNADFSGDETIEITPLNEVISLTQGSDYARQLGQHHLADVVIWGWYRPTENPNITIHIENMLSSQSLPLKESEILQPVATLAELESFSFQQQSGQETSALVSFLAGFIDYRAKNYATALARFDQALASLGNDSPRLLENQADIYFYKAVTFIFSNEYQLAVEDFDRAIQINPQYAQAYNGRAVAFEHLGEYQRAIQEADQAIQIDPQLAEAYINRGVVYAQLGEYQRAIQDYDQAIQIDPQFALAYNNRGVIYESMNNYQRAIQDYDQAIRIDPQFTSAYNNRGNSYAHLAEYRRAIQDYDQAIRTNPKNAGAHYNRAIAYRNLGKYERAIQDYNQAIQINPQFALAYNNRGIVYEFLADYQRAIQDYDQAIQINPIFEEAYYNRGNAYRMLGEFQRAIQDYNQALQINPLDAEAYNNLGVVYRELGEYQLAIQNCNQALQINPYLAEAYLNRGIIYQRLGDLAKAQTDLAKYKDLTGKTAP